VARWSASALSLFMAGLALALVFAYNGVLLDLCFKLGHGHLWRLDGFITEAAIVGLALSPPGQSVVGYLIGFRRPGAVEHAMLQGDLDRVEQRIRMAPPLRLHVIRRPDVNAFVLGTRHLAVTQGYFRLPSRSRDAVLAHELGHAAGRHAALTLSMTAMSTVGNWFGFVVTTLATALVAAASLHRVRGRSATTHVLLAGLLGIVMLLHYLLMGIAWAGFAIQVRRMEYEADRFAARHGYGHDLAAVLQALSTGNRRGGVVGLLWASHPSTRRRLNRLARAMEAGQAL
jgi:Zn-dependent protease with chaperone function